MRAGRKEMGRIVRCSFAAALIAAMMLVPMAAPPAHAAPEAPPEEAAPADANLECHGEPLTGSGPGFLSSREQSEAVAVEEWLAKAKEVYAEAAWETAKDAGISCAVQGLYSKCFAVGFPCRPKSE